MLPEALAALASTAASAIVQAAATDAWDRVRSRLSELFARDGSSKMVEERLSLTNAHIIAAQDSTRSITLQKESNVWKSHLEGLLDRYPDAAISLAALTQELRENALRQPSGSEVNQRAIALGNSKQAVLGSGVQNVTFGP